ncbi:unnamed protein product [Eruca vesicaria subsp. sativa]|uniref:Phorbol-ester/DAG-type domain-containing protein n=1 Tax=Eruca vesicaria subsp. sativa TaxID=29727 RepID=A0ABC8JZZ7_ERUVS|nr:unnamed protein product [Eruca vesicaria subsp. sativa]
MAPRPRIMYFRDRLHTLKIREIPQQRRSVKAHDILKESHTRHVLQERTCNGRMVFCKLCGNGVSHGSITYYCRLCKSYFHKNCLTITNPKIHEHTLTYLRRKHSFGCDACGFVRPDEIDMFGCLQCDFFVHRSCIFLPRVIKLTRHSHYLSHVFHVLDDEAKCGVCQGRFSSGYGGYACVDKTCDYVVHSTCATNINVWDGIDHVEVEPEEESSSEDASLELMDDKKVHHFSHDHGLSRIPVDEECWQLCEACILPIDMGTFLGCKECSFALHEECARLPQEMDHPLHRHRLTLKVTKEGFFTCSACNQGSCGFKYQCCQEDCGFKIDAKCASFTDPFKHKTHKCPLYLRLEDLANRKSYLCCGCHEHSTTVATCTTCEDYSFDFKCLNLPPVMRYKYDIHPLILYFDRIQYKIQQLEKRWDSYLFLDRGRDRQPNSWCDVCEEEVHEYLLFYVCFICRTTLHAKCILGSYPYMKPGHNIKVKGLKIQIASNSGASRPICHTCHSLCGDKLVFKENDLCFCSLKCMHSTKLVITSE